MVKLATTQNNARNIFFTTKGKRRLKQDFCYKVCQWLTEYLCTSVLLKVVLNPNPYTGMGV
jgi:hypothetical protein